jgi:hypothetical protein
MPTLKQFTKQWALAQRFIYINDMVIQRLKIAVLAIIGLIVLYYLFASAAAPVRKITHLNNIALSDSVFMSKNTEIGMHKHLLPLVKEESYKKAMIAMAKQDSIGLVINFADSSALLMLKGVEIHRSIIQKYSIDKVYKGIKAPAFKKIFSQPLHNLSEYSTVVKEPIVVKKAPQTPEEALELATIPDTIITGPAYVWYGLEHGFKLVLVQDNWTTPEDMKVKRQFMRELRRKKLNNRIKSFINVKEVHYTPTVVIELNAREVRAIYRALPRNASIVLHF